MAESWLGVGALDTSWTLPATCATITTKLAFNYVVGCYAGGCDAKCFPQPSQTVTNPYTYFTATACPNGYAKACSGGARPSDLTLCCLSGFTCPGTRGFECAKDPFVNGIATFWVAPSDFPAVIPTSFPLTTTTNTPAFAALHRAIAISPGTALSFPATTNSTSTGASSSSTLSSPSNQKNGGLSPGAKIAIAVSVPVGFLVVFILVPLLFWRRRKSINLAAAPPASSTQKKENVNSSTQFGKSELWAGENAVPPEVDSREVAREVFEADGGPIAKNDRRHELPS
ncbi:hypothetical protein BKA63DRAFT_517280 [Paraphoma chrysanthemicola]|nr:hypothetical protein BKA63DRAFT_517280 [Paraphoma chrysanthemicola]